MPDIVLKRRPDGTPSFKGVEHIDIVHSPTGMEWGYGGSGPADLALNILRACGVQQDEVDTLYQDFKFAFIAPLPPAGGVIRRREVLDWVRKMRELRAARAAGLPAPASRPRDRESREEPPAGDAQGGLL
jgi:hypothetical protein